MNSDIIEISEINFDKLNDSYNSGPGSSSKKTNFGGGIELLMNDKQRESSKMSSDINIDDLNNLEEELNNLVDDSSSSANSSAKFSSSAAFSKSGGGAFSSAFDDKPNVRFEDGPNIGQYTAENHTDTKTWDGFSKFNNIPVNPDKPMSNLPQLSKEEMLREKFKFLRKLESLEKKGVELTKKYSMESSLMEMQGEYEMIMEEKAAKNSIKFQANMMMAVVNGMEFLNNRFDPFDIKLDGWGDQINENINDYDEVFGELYEKYKSKATMSPELKLMFQLGGSAMMVHMTNTMFKTAMPGMDDIFRQNPDLMRHFQSAAVNSMGDSNPGFAGFMNNVMSPEPSVPFGKGPPAPLATQGPNSPPVPSSRPGNNNYAQNGGMNGSGSGSNGSNRRPDISMGRGVFANSSSASNDGINVRENFGSSSDNDQTKRVVRAEMKGPSDISEILSGLKTKTINIQESQQQQQQQQQQQNTFHQQDTSANDSSTISISDLKEMQGDINLPKKSNRRKKSDKNTVSLDI